MLKVHVAERLAVAAGLVPADRPARRFISLGIVVVVLAAVVGLTTLYIGVRELTQPGSVYERAADTVEALPQLAPEAGPGKLMSIDDMRRLSDEE